MTALRRATHAAAFMVVVVWWLPTILLALALVGAFHINTWRIVRRARRLRLAGRLDEAAAVLERAMDRVRQEGVGRGD